jgi:hypothetical protein
MILTYTAMQVTTVIHLQNKNMQPEESLNYEKEIVWLYDLSNYPWAREEFGLFRKRQGKCKSDGRQLIGYAELEDNAPLGLNNGRSKYFYRRIFVINHGDYEGYKNSNNCPREAVDPLTVKPKILGTSPKRFA